MGQQVSCMSSMSISSKSNVENDNPKYLDLVQCDPTVFNKLQKEKQKEYENKHGKKALDEILWNSNKHHELKASRSVDYSLNGDELETLKTNGILFKQMRESFPSSYLKLYNNDMPVIITSDSMLHALHKFYDKWLKFVEETTLNEKLTLLCKSLLDELYTITPTSQNSEYLQQLEVFFMIPLTIMSLNNELSETINDQPTLLYSADEIKLMLSESYERKSQGQLDWNKLRQFEKFMGQSDIYRICQYHPKLFSVVQNFKLPDVDQPIKLKFGGDVLFNEFIKLIATHQDIDCKLGDVTIKMMGTLFKPRGHYTESLQLKKYFMAFTWLSKFDIVVNDNQSSINTLLIGSMIAKISEKHLTIVDEIQDFISMIIGKSDGYTLSSFLNLINQYMPKMESLDETTEWLLNNSENLWKNVMSGPYEKPQLGKFGDLEGDTHELSFSLFGKGTQIDNIIISNLVDNKLVEDNGKLPYTLRKFPLIFDLVYTLFNNKSVKDDIDHLMQNVKVSQRDGYQYNKKLESLSAICDNHQFDNTLYAQELKMLRSLMADNDMLNKLNVFPFNTTQWGKKQAISQIAHYAELRHDNCLYIEECSGMMCACEYPDLLVEPVPTFWKEMLVLVNMMKKMVKVDSRHNRILTNFSDILNTFIEYLDLHLNDKPIDEKMLHKLKSIIIEHHGSGSISYGGWYAGLFHDCETEMQFKPEVSSCFTGVDDERGSGGILHLGTGPCKMMYLMITDPRTNEKKIMLGPTYSAYEVMTNYNTRLNDEEWGKQYVNYIPF